MTSEELLHSEESLDPQDWDALRALGHRMIDDMLDYTRTVSDRPPWRHAPEQVKASLREPLPVSPQPLEQVYEQFLEDVLPYPLGNIHPRFWAWVLGTGTFTGALAELLAATMNTNTGGGDHQSANHVEKQVIAWIAEMMGFPPTCSGLLTTGGSASNLIGLAVARNAMAAHDLRSDGICASEERMVLYASREIHSSVQKAVELLGLGSAALRHIGTNRRFEIDRRVLRQAIVQDREQGHSPFCIVGAAGTTNTGAVDDLHALADIAEEQSLWLHVDGAFGAWAAIAPEASALVAGMERADSLALDLHKWMYMPYEIGAVLVRREADHRQAFALTPDYLTHGGGGRGASGGDIPWFSDYGFELSRGFRGLKAWMSLKEHGVAKYGRLIQQNIDQAHYLAGLVRAAADLELMADVTLNIVCFRYVHPDLDDNALDLLNRQIVVELQERGLAMPSVTNVRGRAAVRTAHTNHRTRREDLDALVYAVRCLGAELAGVDDSLRNS